MRTAFLALAKNSAGATVSAGVVRWRRVAELKDLETKDSDYEREVRFFCWGSWITVGERRNNFKKMSPRRASD
jgi:hypothetical protein